MIEMALPFHLFTGNMNDWNGFTLSFIHGPEVKIFEWYCLICQMNPDEEILDSYQ